MFPGLPSISPRVDVGPPYNVVVCRVFFPRALLRFYPNGDVELEKVTSGPAVNPLLASRLSALGALDC